MQITSYQLLLETSSDGFVEQPDLCDGSDQETIDNSYCTILMSEFWSEPFNLVLGDTIKAKVIAVNERGASMISTENSATVNVQTVPSQMTSPTRGADTTAFQVELDWQAPNNGGSAIISYELVDITDSSNVVIFTGESSYVGIKYTITDNIIPGESYLYKMRAQNKWGWSEYSLSSD
jgi:hypothetical protein